MTERQNHILLAIVEQYAEVASPVGSSILAKLFDVSSATIRAEMAELERLGYISQPHTSAGRVPTDKGYRYYVNNLSETKKTETSSVERRGEKALETRVSHGGLPERTIRNAVDTLVELTHNLGLAQQVSGTPISEIEAAHELNKIAITDIDIGGGNALHAYKPDTVSILLLPPGFDEWIHRMHARGDLPADEISRRMQTAVTVISDALAQDFYHFVINRDLEETVRTVHELSSGVPADATLELEAKSLAVQLEIDVRIYLENANASATAGP